MASGDLLATIHPWAIQQPTSNFAIVDTRNRRRVTAFAVGQSGVWSFPSLEGYGGNGITIRLRCAMAIAVSNNIIVNGAFDRKIEGTSLDTDSFATAQVSNAITVPDTVGNIFLVTIAFTNAQIDGIASGDSFDVQLSRVTAAPSEATGNLLLISGQIRET